MLNRRGEGPYLIYRNASTGERFLKDGLVVPVCYTAFSKNKKMVVLKKVGSHAAEDQRQYEFPA